MYIISLAIICNLFASSQIHQLIGVEFSTKEKQEKWSERYCSGMIDELEYQ